MALSSMSAYVSLRKSAATSPSKGNQEGGMYQVGCGFGYGACHW
jgi:hypothetical protein